MIIFICYSDNLRVFRKYELKKASVVKTPKGYQDAKYTCCFYTENKHTKIFEDEKEAREYTASKNLEAQMERAQKIIDKAKKTFIPEKIKIR